MPGRPGGGGWGWGGAAGACCTGRAGGAGRSGSGAGVAGVDGGAASAGGRCAASGAGAPGKRYALPHARIMMHQPSGGIGGTASDIRIQAEQMLYTKKKMAELIAGDKPENKKNERVIQHLSSCLY